MNVARSLYGVDLQSDAAVQRDDDPDVAGPAWWGLAAIGDARGDCEVAVAARARAVQTDPELARRCVTAPVGA